jgi:hypothetical protein
VAPPKKTPSTAKILATSKGEKLATNIVLAKGVKKQAAANAQLLYNGGPLLANVAVTTIFYGAQWNTDPYRAQLDAFFDFIVTSSLIDQLSEYSTNGFTIGHGSHVASVIIGDYVPSPSTVDDSAIQTLVQDLIAAGTVPAQTPNSLYFVFTPSGVTVTLQGLSSCVDFCGYHNNTASGVFYAVVPYADCAGCLFASTIFDSMTVIASHELCEAITDPIPGQSWYDNANGEIGDICENSNKVISAATPLTTAAASLFSVSVSPGSVTIDGTAPVNLTVTLTPATAPPPPPPPTTGYTVQTEWSNSQGACI